MEEITIRYLQHLKWDLRPKHTFRNCADAGTEEVSTVKFT